jgi:hypothetical protein
MVQPSVTRTPVTRTPVFRTYPPYTHLSCAHPSLAPLTTYHFGKTVMRILLKTAPPGADAGPSRRVARVWFCIAKPFEAHW